ncbi:Tyrosine--tRNA ligase [Chlamydiales bacterium STE3]|nr:Tyrosine--tRNA ligase [Chlamydiales bacterium STE3]
MENVVEILKERGFIDSISSEELTRMVEKPIKVYCGFDPTADSLHLGNFVAIMGLAWFQRCGHTPVVIVGGATGMIGDPSGKSAERILLTEGIVEKNLEGIRKNLSSILKMGSDPIFLNNFDWFKNFSFLGFLRDVAKYFRVGTMLAKDSVKARLNSEEGLSFTEFSYQVLQGYDFLYLYKNHQVSVQLGGSDQWGNITAGIELIRKVTGESGFGLTFPLLTKSDGQKFGKSEKGAIWLSPEKLSPYEFYQHLFRTQDADVIKLMRMLTFMEMGEIRDYENRMKNSDYIPNSAQKRLAEEVTRIVHGEEGLQTALKVTEAAKPGAQTELDVTILEALSKDMPSVQMAVSELMNTKIIDVLAKSGLQASKSEARKLIKNGGVYLNNQQVQDIEAEIKNSDIIGEKMLLLAVGKKNKLLIRVVSP